MRISIEIFVLQSNYVCACAVIGSAFTALKGARTNTIREMLNINVCAWRKIKLFEIYNFEERNYKFIDDEINVLKSNFDVFSKRIKYHSTPLGFQRAAQKVRY